MPATASAARSFDKRFGANDNGGITMAANTVMSCALPPATCGKENATPNQTTNSNYDNNEWDMVRLDMDGDSATTLNSSTATLNLPAGATVLWAGLYWGAKTDAGTNGVAADAAARDQAKFKPAGGSYSTVTADTIDVNSDSAYQAFADVTAKVAAAGAGLYSVGDIQAATGRDRYGAWSLVVAYHDDSAPARNLTIFDGFQPISNTAAVGPSTATIPVSGFETPPAPNPVNTKIGAVTYEGDLGLTGDQIKLNGVNLTDGVNPATNFFNSTVSVDGTQVTAGRSPSQLNHFGFDADMLSAPAGSLANGATSANISVATTSETFYPGVLTFATDLYAPKVRPVTTVEDLNGGNIEPGDVLRYTTTGKNIGTDQATSLVLTNGVPAEFQLLENTLKVTGGAGVGPQTADAGDDLASWDSTNRVLTWNLGNGASAGSGGSLPVDDTFTYTYDVVVGGQTNGSTHGGPATADYTGQSTGYTFETEGSGGGVTIAVPDLTVDLTRTGALTRGGTATYTLDVSNVGAATSSGQVSVVDDLPAGLELNGSATGTGWSCSAVGQRVTCTRSDALTVGSHFPLITIPVSVRQDATSPLANAATVSGGSDGVHTNDTDSDSAAADSKSALSLSMPSPAGSIAPGETTTLHATVTNGGPSDALGVAVVLTVPADLELVSAKVGGVDCSPTSCAVGTVPAGQTAVVDVVVRAKDSAHGTTQQVSAVETAASTDTSAGNDSADANVVVRELRPVSVTQTITPSTLVAGGPVQLQISVSNAGPSTAGGVVFHEPLPAGVTNVNVTSTAVCAVMAGTLSCTLPDLAAGEHIDITVDGTIASGAAGDDLEFTASIDPVAGDPDHTDDSVTTTRTVAGEADLSLVLVSAPDHIVAGTAGTWVFRATNSGPSEAPETEFRLPIPAGATFVSATGASCVVSGSDLVCSLGTLGPAAARDISIKLSVPAGASSAPVVLDPTVESGATDPDADDATVHVSTPVTRTTDLQTFQSHGSAPVVAGAAASWSSTVKNAGPSDATNVVITQAVPGALNGATVKLTGVDGTCTITDGVARCVVPALAAGQTATLVLSGTVASNAGGKQLEPAVSAQGDQPDGNPADNSALDPAAAGAVTDLGVTAQAPTEYVFTGQTVGLTLTVSNAGPSDATSVIVTKELPAGATVVDLDPRCSVSGTTLTCNLGTVGVGESLSIDVKVLAKTSFDGRLLTANASVKGAESDTVSANNDLGPAANIAAACSSKRKFPIHLRFPHGVVVKKAVVTVDGKKVKAHRKGKRWIATVDLRGSKKATVKVKITGHTKAGKRITGTRTYHPCILKIKKPKPPKV